MMGAPICPLCRCDWSPQRPKDEPLVHHIERDWQSELNNAVLKCGSICGCMLFCFVIMAIK